MRYRFIPFRKADVVDMLCDEGGLDEAGREGFRRFARILEAIIHFRAHADLEALKDAYVAFNPDRDTRQYKPVDGAARKAAEQRLVDRLEAVLNAANFERLREEDLAHALADESIFHISLKVPFDELEHYVLHWRGETTHDTTVKGFLGRNKRIQVPTYERVALLVQFKDAAYFGKRAGELPFKPGSMAIKLFHDIPKADLEMLFPNTRVGMTARDMAVLLVPSVAGSVGLLAKSGAAAFGVFSILWVLLEQLWRGKEPSLPTSAELAGMVAALTAFGAVAGYVARQWGKYKNAKLSFMKTLTDNLYFRNLDNNAGVFHHLVDDAEEEECKETLIAYYFLLTKGAQSMSALDACAEAWLKAHGVDVDFEVADALRKLANLKLSTQRADGYVVLRLPDALRQLDTLWDGFFVYA